MFYSTPFQAMEETGSSDNYYKQFPTVAPKLGGVYKQAKNIFQKTYKIIFVGEGVA